MLASRNRLTEKRDFDKVKNEAKILQSDTFAASYLKWKESKETRFAFIISTKISKSAVIRNRAKRALREGARQMLAYTKGGFDIIFLAKPEIAKKYTGDIVQEVSKALDKAGLTKWKTS